jgi:hypothetical protein
VYDILINNNEYIGPQSVTTMGINITVTIRSADSSDVKTIQLEGQGHLFSVDTGITLKLQDIVLRGHSTNNLALVAVGNGTLILNSGANITQNTNTSGPGMGGGIYVNGGILELNEGCGITKNATNNYGGGGILSKGNGSIIMRGGTISENIVTSSSATGGGICIEDNSTMIMSGGIISKNQAGARGGGIRIEHSSSTFTKRAISGSTTSGIIYGGTGDNANIASGYGGGYGHAIHRKSGSKEYRNTTLGPGDEITTLSDVGWE